MRRLLTASRAGLLVRAGVVAVAALLALAIGFIHSANSQAQTVAQTDCGCWIDTKTGKSVPTAPASGVNFAPASLDVGAAQIDPTDRNRAVNSRTGQNFVRQADGCWIDTKTGKPVPTVPASGVNFAPASLDAGAAQIDPIDRNRAVNSTTGQNFVRVPCPPPQTAGAPVGVKTTLVGVVLPSDARPGETMSGTVVTNPDQYKGVPALRVVLADVPAAQDAQGHASLQGLVIDMGDGKSQPADTGVVITTPKNATQAPLIFRREDTPKPVAEKTVPLKPATSAPAPVSGTSATPAPEDYEAPPVSMAGNIQVIRGPFGGNRNETQILVDDRPGTIVAEGPRAAYWHLPEGTQPGPHRVTLREHGTDVSFPIAVLRLDMSADRYDLVKGQSTTLHAIVSGADRLTVSPWHAGAPFDIVDTNHIREVARDFKIPAGEQPGVILLQIQNTSPDTISISPAKNEVVVLSIGRDQFAKGLYEFTGTIKSKRSGRFSIDGLVVPFLAPIKGEPVPLGAPAPQ